MDILSRLNNVEEDFVTAFLADNPSSLEYFETSWTRLADSVTGGSLDPQSAHLAHAAAYRVEALASALLRFHHDSAALNTSLVSDLSKLLDHLSLSDSDAPPLLSPAPSLQPSSGCPPYIAPAYKWLLKNIHNPYPSKETKILLSQGTGTSLQNIDAWFLNARRRIGWTNISRRYFSGSKPHTIAAAQRALADEACIDVDWKKEPLSANVRMAFVQMESAAKDLYSAKFSKSALAGKLDSLVKDMTDEDKRRRKEERVKVKNGVRRLHELDRAAKKGKKHCQKWKEANAMLLSPTTTRLTPPALGIDIIEQDGKGLTIGSIPKRKRRSSEDATEDRSETGSLSNRPTKRPRRVPSSVSLYSSSAESQPSGCASRASSCTLSTSEDEPQTPPTYDIIPIPLSHENLPPRNLPPLPGQRRLSEAGIEPAQRQACPRRQVVSDSFLTSACSYSSPSVSSSSTSSSMPSPLFEIASIPCNDWSSLFFDTPETVVLDELDLSVLREPEFSCVSETAAMLNGGSKGLNEFVIKGSDPFSIQTSLSDYDGLDPLFGSNHLDSWPYSDMTQLLSVQPPPVTITIDKSGAQSPLAREALATLDDFSLASLPATHFPTRSPTPPDAASSTPSALSTPNNIAHIDWLSIIPQPLLSNAFDSTTSIDAIEETSKLQPVAEALIKAPSSPTADSAVGTSALPLTITSEIRAEKLRQYKELLDKAKWLEAELGRS